MNSHELRGIIMPVRIVNFYAEHITRKMDEFNVNSLYNCERHEESFHAQMRLRGK